MNRRWQAFLLSVLIAACLVLAACDTSTLNSNAGIATTAPTYSSTLPGFFDQPTPTKGQAPDNGGASSSSADLNIFVEPGAGDAPIVNAINAAQKSVALEVYILTDTPIIDALIAAHQRGVQVRVMLEQHPFGGGNYNQQTQEKLVNGGVDFKWSNPTYALTHAKYLVVDNAAALILTLNLSKSAVTGNREYGIVATDPRIANEAAHIFEADWQRTSYQPTDPRTVLSPVNSRAQFMALISSARHTLLVEDEELQDSSIISALINVQKRGVKVQVLLEDPKQVSTNRASGDQLRAGGVQVQYQTSPYLHAKMILADTAHVYIGSVNLSTQSMDQNREVGLILDNAPIISVAQRTFQQDWAKGAA